MYDDIASLYHLLYPDWDAAILKQSSAYHETAVSMLGHSPEKVLDVSCGIGTQALGLAIKGCEVTASDLSAKAVARAQREADARGLRIAFQVADMRDCFATHGSGYDLVISADNSIPHLAGRDEVKRAVEGMYRCLRPGGVLLVGVRDYQPDEKRGRGQVFSYGTREHDGDRYVVFQTRDWDGDAYDVGMYFVREVTQTSPAAVVSGISRYYAITVEALQSVLLEAGFVEVQRLDGVTHNVVVSGKVPARQ